MRQQVFLLLGAMALAGCNKGPSLKTYPVAGTVTYDGKPLAGATVTYVGTNPEAPRSTGVTDNDGRFSIATYVTSQELLRGAPPGDYKVTITKQSVSSTGPTGNQFADVDYGKLSPAEQQKMTQEMSKMMAQQTARPGASEKDKPASGPKSEIPLKYATAEKSGLTAQVLAGENEPREFKLTDD